MKRWMAAFLLGTISKGNPVSLLRGNDHVLQLIWSLICEIKTETQLRELAEQMIEQDNSHNGKLTVDGLMSSAMFDTNGNLKDWNLSKYCLKTLPESFGNLTVGRHL